MKNNHLDFLNLFLVIMMYMYDLNHNYQLLFIMHYSIYINNYYTPNNACNV